MSDARAQLPFEIDYKLGRTKAATTYYAIKDNIRVGIGAYAPGNSMKRNKLAAEWSKNPKINDGRLITRDNIADELQLVEIEADDAFRTDVTEAEGSEDDGLDEHAAYVDETMIVELAWNSDLNRTDFITYDRQSCAIDRMSVVKIGDKTIVPPTTRKRVVTPGGHIPGTVFVPTEHDEAGTDETRLREDILSFINRYATLGDNMARLSVEYILLSWLFDSFDEVPYLSFRTADMGRGKSRALETVGTLCCRPIFCGGGSTAAATLRLLDLFQGTLVSDEFDQGDTELASAINKVILQGFQRNRPIVKCCGDANEPIAFGCYGPKLFALRKGFADDAAESRMISVHMIHPRGAAPICLIRLPFDAAALAIRNRLLAWRFANFS